MNRASSCPSGIRKLESDAFSSNPLIAKDTKSCKKHLRKRKGVVRLVMPGVLFLVSCFHMYATNNYIHHSPVRLPHIWVVCWRKLLQEGSFLCVFVCMCLCAHHSEKGYSQRKFVFIHAKALAFDVQ